MNYLFSEVDISDTTQWQVGEKIPAIMQKADGSFEVGMCVLAMNTDGPKAYYVISKDENGVDAYRSTAAKPFDLNSVIRNDGKKQTFTTLNEAYAYYKTLNIEKKTTESFRRIP